LTLAAYETWDELADESGLKLVTKTGGIDLAVRGTTGEDELDNCRRSINPFSISWPPLTDSDFETTFRMAGGAASHGLRPARSSRR